MAMRVICMMLVATHALREMEGANEMSAESFGAVRDDGKCRARAGIPGFAAHDINCGSMKQQSMCDMLSATCRWVPARMIAAHCKAKPEHPEQKAVCDANKNNQQVCGHLTMFCDWVPAQKVYDGMSGGSMSGVSVPTGSSAIGADDGKCRARAGIPGFAAHDINCGSMKQQSMCDMLSATCRWVPARLIEAHCKAKPEHPYQKAVCEANRNNEMVCTHLPQFCDWVPAQKVYD